MIQGTIGDIQGTFSDMQGTLGNFQAHKANVSTVYCRELGSHLYLFVLFYYLANNNNDLKPNAGMQPLRLCKLP